MSILAPMVLKQQVFAGKAETNTGTAIAISGTDGTVIVYADQDTITLDTDFVKRQGQGTSSPHPGVPGAQVASVKFSTELVGSGTGATSPTWEKYLLAAGFAVSNNVSGSNTAYTPVTGSASMVTLTEGHYIDGMLYKARGVSHDFTLKGEAGKPAMFDWTGKGGWVDPTATSMITPTYDTSVIPPRFVSSTFTIGGQAYIIKGFELAMNNTIAVRLDGGSPNGVHSTAVTHREMTLQMDVEAATSKIWPTDYTAGATAAASLTIGSTAGNIWTIAVPVAQLVEPPQKIDLENGVMGYRLKFAGVRNSSLGDDELSITQS